MEQNPKYPQWEWEKPTRGAISPPPLWAWGSIAEGMRPGLGLQGGPRPRQRAILGSRSLRARRLFSEILCETWTRRKF